MGLLPKNDLEIQPLILRVVVQLFQGDNFILFGQEKLITFLVNAFYFNPTCLIL